MLTPPAADDPYAPDPVFTEDRLDRLFLEYSAGGSPESIAARAGCSIFSVKRMTTRLRHVARGKAKMRLETTLVDAMIELRNAGFQVLVSTDGTVTVNGVRFPHSFLPTLARMNTVRPSWEDRP